MRSPVPIAFEQFALPADHCADRQIDAVWLEYGRGPKRQPTVWCCGDMVPRDPLVLVQNADFRRFHRYLTAQRNSRYQFAVTATLTGRFDYSRAEICPDGKSRCCLDGFGHFGAACARIVI